MGLPVVRCFEDSDIIHVEGSVDPVRDIDIINIELALADMAQVQYTCMNDDWRVGGLVVDGWIGG